MFNNYIKVALRGLFNQKTFAFINVFSLSLGLACCLLILLFVQNELSYDRFHRKVDSIFRVYGQRLQDSGDTFSFASLPIPLGPALTEQFPEIRRFTRFANETVIVGRNEKLFAEQALFADPAVLEIFSFPLLQGNSATALRTRNAVVITEAMADKYFGNSQVIGEELRIRIGNNVDNFMITGIVDEIPKNSSIRFDFLVPFEQSDIFAARGTVWTSWNSYLFIELTDNSSVSDLEEKLAFLIEERLPGSQRKLHLQPLNEVHMSSAIAGGLEPASDPMYSFILGGIALLVLVIACINFMVLSVGRSATRLKEVGMRKVLGAARLQLFRQFWAEALAMCLLSFLFGLIVAKLFLPVFNQLAHKELSLSALWNLDMIMILFSLIILVGLVSGSYPALVLSHYRPVELFKGIFDFGGKDRLNRQLIVIQFGIAIILMVGTLAMSRQMSFLQSKSLGFTTEQIVVLENRSNDREALVNLLRNALMGYSEILNTTGAQFSFTSGSHRVGFQYQDESYAALEFRIDPHFLATMDIPIISGRNFSSEIAADNETSVIVNESFIEMLNLDDPLGLTFMFRGNPNMQIVGVTSDFNFLSLHEPIQPMVMHMNDMARISSIFVRIAPMKIQKAMQTIESEWRKIAPELPFVFSFLDENLARQYVAEQRWSDVVRYSSLFAILVACLGLFGLASLHMRKRTKEISVRKVMGASAVSIARLLSRDFVILIMISNLIAWPLAWYGTNKWLENFANRIEISWWIFAVVGSIALGIALLTISAHAIRAALANPIDALRYE